MKWDITYLKWKWFDMNPQNINKTWRPRKQFSVILSEVEDLWYKRPSDSEIVELCGLLLSLSEEELKRIQNADEFPMIMKIIATRLLSNRGFETVEKILDRIYGKTMLKWSLDEDKIVNIVIQDNNVLTEEQEMKIVEIYLKKKNLSVISLWD